MAARTRILAALTTTGPHGKAIDMVLRLGLLGAARIAPVAIIEPARLLPGAEVVAVAARDPMRAAAFAGAHAIAHVSPTYEALIERADVDLIYNALPIPLHERWTVAALRAGKHVLLEKPSASSAESARRMVECARESGRRLIEAFHYRYHPLFRRILEIAPELGDIHDVKAVIDVPVPQRPGEIRWDPAMAGGALMDLGCYPVHWLRTLCGPFDVVSCELEMAPAGVDAAATCALRFHSGPHAAIFCSMKPHDRGRLTTLAVTGARGELFVRNPIAPQMGHELRWRRDGDKAWREEQAPMTTSYFHQLEAVAHAISNKLPLPTEGGDIIDNLAALEALYAAGGHPRTDNSPG